MLKILHHHGNENLQHNEIALQPHQMANIKKKNLILPRCFEDKE